jgi:hypothetical protein
MSQKIYRKLKSFELATDQIKRLKNIALAMCISQSYRREFTALSRLMIKLADQEFIQQLQHMMNSESGLIKKKSLIMFDIIINNRRTI